MGYVVNIKYKGKTLNDFLLMIFLYPACLESQEVNTIRKPFRFNHNVFIRSKLLSS